MKGSLAGQRTRRSVVTRGGRTTRKPTHKWHNAFRTGGTPSFVAPVSSMTHSYEEITHAIIKLIGCHSQKSSRRISHEISG